MTETETAAPSQPPGASTPRGVKIALAMSVGLNLAVAGLAAGAWLEEGSRKGLPRDMSFGPFSEALDDSDRHAIREALKSKAGEFRASREAMQAEFQNLLSALRADPFDVTAMKSALAAIEARNAERLGLGRSLIEARLVEMSPADRQAFADRLERGLRRGGKD
jgi:uncharacterized membrane protein